MKIYITDQGDGEVGISANYIELEWNTEYPDGRGREEERSVFRRFVKEWLDFNGMIDVRYADECMECGKVCGEDVGICSMCAARNFAERL